MASSLDANLGLDADFNELQYGQERQVIQPSVLRTGSFGGLRLVGYTDSAADPTITEYPHSQDYGFHFNSTSGKVYLVFNLSGVIKKVELT